MFYFFCCTPKHPCSHSSCWQFTSRPTAVIHSVAAEWTALSLWLNTWPKIMFYAKMRCQHQVSQFASDRNKPKQVILCSWAAQRTDEAPAKGNNKRTRGILFLFLIHALVIVSRWVAVKRFELWFIIYSSSFVLFLIIRVICYCHNLTTNKAALTTLLLFKHILEKLWNV